jgi:hypothetical protein
MTSKSSPITPPPELVQGWRAAASNVPATLGTETEPRRDYIDYIATAAAQWGADQELEACCEWTTVWISAPEASQLRAARRPKPPSLKEQALLQLDTLNADLAMHGRGCDLFQIRRALEALPND